MIKCHFTTTTLWVLNFLGKMWRTLIWPHLKSRVGRNGFSHKFSTFKSLLLLQFSRFLQFFLQSLHKSGGYKTTQPFFWFLSSKTCESALIDKKVGFSGFENSAFWKKILENLRPKIKKGLCCFVTTTCVKRLQKTFWKNLENSRRSSDLKIHRSASRKTAFRPLCGQMVR